MEIGEIISESFRYPFNNSSDFFRVAALFMLFVIPAIFSTITLFSNNALLIVVSSVIIVVCYLILVLIARRLFTFCNEGWYKSVWFNPRV